MFRKETPPEVSGFGERIKNVFRFHFRGLIGTFGMIVIAAIFIFGVGMDETWKKVLLIWFLMFWCFLWQPVNIPITGTIPLILLPFLGVIKTVSVAPLYFTETIALFILSSMLAMLINVTGVDRRMILSMMHSNSYTPAKLVTNASMTSFLMSILGNRLIICMHMYDLTLPIYDKLAVVNKETKSNMDLNGLRNVVNNAIQVSSCFGSIVMPHGAWTILTFRTGFMGYKPYEDCFNYLQYIAFSLPTMLFFQIISLIYHRCLMGRVFKGQLLGPQSAAIKSYYAKLREDLCPLTFHEMLSVFFFFLYILLVILRYSQWGGYIYTKETVGDVTIAACFVILLHMLPNNLQFLKYLTASNKSQLPVAKPASGQLWWKYLDTNVNYGYIYLIGAVNALSKGIQLTQLESILQEFIEPPHDMGLLMGVTSVAMTGCILGNIMSGVPACIMLMPMVMTFQTTETWQKYTHLGALAIGMGTSVGLMFPFRYTPAFYCHFKGKTPMKTMAWYSLPILIIYSFFLPLFIVYLGQGIWPEVNLVAKK